MVGRGSAGGGHLVRSRRDGRMKGGRWRLQGSYEGGECVRE